MPSRKEKKEFVETFTQEKINHIMARGRNAQDKSPDARTPADKRAIKRMKDMFGEDVDSLPRKKN